MITSNVVTISPSLAKAYLEKSKGNRNISNAFVKNYAEDMKNGKWVLNGAAIKFDEEGTLIDGHHRLHAVIRAGVSVKSVVTRGVSSEGSVETVDNGRNRNLSQLIGWYGGKHYVPASSLLYAYFQIVETGKWGNDVGISSRKKKKHRDLLDFYKSDEERISKCAQLASSLGHGITRVLKVSAIGGITYYLIRNCGYDYDFVADFFNQVCSYNNSKNKSIEALRIRMLKERENAKTKSIQDSIVYALIVKTWNNYVTDRYSNVLKFNPNIEDYPKPIEAKQIR